MKATGIVRRIDDLGRVVIPKEIRRTMRIREGDPLEIYTTRDGEVIFKKYSLSSAGWDFAAQLLRHPGPQHGFHRRCHRPGRHRGRSRGREAGSCWARTFSAAGADHGAAQIYQYPAGQERLPVPSAGQ